MPTLFDPLRLGSLELPNRILMAPLTRCRSEPGDIPGRLMATHYAQRASAGLIVAEATMVAAGNAAFPGAPLNAPDPSTFYTPGPKDYTDYPSMAGPGLTGAASGS